MLPLDLDIGAYSEDGEGALLLHRELQADPRLFFPATHNRVVDQIEAMSFHGNTVDVVVRRAAELLNREMTDSRRLSASPVNQGLNVLEAAVTKFLTVIGVSASLGFSQADVRHELTHEQDTRRRIHF